MLYKVEMLIFQERNRYFFRTHVIWRIFVLWFEKVIILFWRLIILSVYPSKRLWALRCRNLYFHLIAHLVAWLIMRHHLHHISAIKIDIRINFFLQRIQLLLYLLNFVVVSLTQTFIGIRKLFNLLVSHLVFHEFHLLLLKSIFMGRNHGVVILRISFHMELMVV